MGLAKLPLPANRQVSNFHLNRIADMIPWFTRGDGASALARHWIRDILCLLCFIGSLQNVYYTLTMHSISSDGKHKRNDSGWNDNGSNIQNAALGKNVLNDAGRTGEIAPISPPVHDAHRNASVSTAARKDGRGIETRIGTTASSTFFGQSLEQDDANSFVEDCISPKTNAPRIDPFSIPDGVHGHIDVRSGTRRPDSGRRKSALELVQPCEKSEATVGWTILDTYRPSDVVESSVNIEETRWHRNRPSRLPSYQSSSSSSSEDPGECSTMVPIDGHCEAESPLEWMMVEDGYKPTSIAGSDRSEEGISTGSMSDRIGSHKSSKFVRNSKCRAQERENSMTGKARRSKDSTRSSACKIKEVRVPGAARPSRHLSYGATLDLPPIGVQSHRSSATPKHIQSDTVHEVELANPTFQQIVKDLEARLDDGTKCRSSQRWITISIIVVVNIALLGLTLFFILEPGIWNESRFAVSRPSERLTSVAILIRSSSWLQFRGQSGCV